MLGLGGSGGALPCVMGVSCVAADGCTGAVHDVTLSQVAAYQSVKIPIMQDQKEIAAGVRKADIVADRAALLRVFVKPAGNWVPRQISARVRVTNGSTVSELFQKAVVSVAPTDATLETTFNVTLPRELVTPTTHYSVELVECTPGQAAGSGARYPATGDLVLGARTTGHLKIHFVPLSVKGKLPDTSETRLAYYKKYLEALYPISALEYTLGPAYGAGNETPDFDSLLDTLRDERGKANLADDVYYFGISPVVASDESDGVGYVADPGDADYRVAVGASSADAEYTASVFGHELGHNHGLEHSPGCDAGDPDKKYPYAKGLIGAWGYDSRSKALLSPQATYDFMTYCQPVWFSDYTYEPVLKRVATLNGSASHVASASIRRAWRVLIVDSVTGPRWGHPFVGVAPRGVPEAASVLDANGNRVASLDVYPLRTDSRRALTFVVPEPALGSYAIELAGLTTARF